MKPAVVPFAELPKRESTLAATCRMDLARVAERMNATLERDAVRDKRAGPLKYGYLCLILSSGRTAILSQDERRGAAIEIALELKDHNFFHEADRLEVAEAMGIDEEYLERFRNGFQWIAPSAQSGT